MNTKDLKRALEGEKNLSGADLSYAVLISSDLQDADLRGSDLRGADLTDADLVGADLTGADLTGADLTEANLSNAILKRADLTDATLTEAGINRRQLMGLKRSLTIEQKMSLHGSIGMVKGDILSSKKSSETYRFVSYTIGVRGEPYANIVNTKSKKRYMRRMYEKESPSGYGILFYVKDRASRIFSNE